MFMFVIMVHYTTKGTKVLIQRWFGMCNLCSLHRVMYVRFTDEELKQLHPSLLSTNPAKTVTLPCRTWVSLVYHCLNRLLVIFLFHVSFSTVSILIPVCAPQLSLLSTASSHTLLHCPFRPASSHLITLNTTVLTTQSYKVQCCGNTIV